MITFEPKELQHEIDHAFRLIEKTLGIPISNLQHDLIDPGATDFDASDYDGEVITSETELSFWLPYADESFQLNYGQLAPFAREMASAELVGGVECWTPTRLLLRAEPLYDTSSYPMFEHLHETEAFEKGALPTEVEWRGVKLRCSVTHGTTLFGFLVLKHGYYDKYFPPILSDEYFLEVTWNKPLIREQIRAVANAYLFELSSTLGVDLRLSPRPDDKVIFLESEEPDEVPIFPLRCLLLGPGIESAVEIYNTAISAPDPHFQVLHFVKVLEYVSQTVVRSQLTDAVRAKLLSPRALNPDADFVVELEALMSEQRAFRKDREALRLTVTACCECTELARISPPRLARLSAIKPDSTEKEKRAALDELAGCLSATRNWIAHAKLSYTPTGEECPPGQLGKLAVCARMAAQQAIRWYAVRHESLRVT